jgi:hypothetical protein
MVNAALDARQSARRSCKIKNDAGRKTVELPWQIAGSQVNRAGWEFL